MSWTEPANIEEAIALADRLADCPLLPNDLKKPQSILLVLGYAASLKINPFSALRTVQVIKNKPTLSADGLAAVVLSSGLVERWEFTESTDERCALLVQRKGLAPFEVVWDMPRARRAGLGGNAMWTNYPRQMLRARAISEAARQGFPDVCAGVYETSEMLQAQDEKPEQKTEPSTRKASAESQRKADAERAFDDLLARCAARLRKLSGKDWSAAEFGAQVRQAYPETCTEEDVVRFADQAVDALDLNGRVVAAAVRKHAVDLAAIAGHPRYLCEAMLGTRIGKLVESSGINAPTADTVARAAEQISAELKATAKAAA